MIDNAAADTTPLAASAVVEEEVVLWVCRLEVLVHPVLLVLARLARNKWRQQHVVSAAFR